jgi:hypothetical protein
MNGTTFHTIMTVNTITPKTTFFKIIIITWSLTSIIRESRVLKTRSTLSNIKMNSNAQLNARKSTNSYLQNSQRAASVNLNIRPPLLGNGPQNKQ